MRLQRICTWSAIGFIAMSWLPALADITMGVFPRRPPADTIKAFKPLAEHLSQVLGEKVKLEVPKDFKEFWKKVENKEYDLVHYNQYHYIKSHKEMGYKVVVVNEEQGERQIAGALAVRKDSGINSVEDLRGKTILFGGGPKAMGSYIAPTSILKKHGLVEGKDYKAEFSKNPPSAVIAVYNKAADASGSGNVILNIQGVKQKIDVEQMKILAESEPFIHLTWAVKGDMPDDKVKKIQDAMSSLSGSDAGKEVLKAAKVSNFHAASNSDFDRVREITNFTIGEQY